MNKSSDNGAKKRPGGPGRNPLPDGQRTRGRTLHMNPSQWGTLDQLGGGPWLRGEMDRKRAEADAQPKTAQES